MTAEEIIAVSAEHFKLKPQDLVGKTRNKNVVNARQVAMVIIRQQLKLSYPKIGLLFWRDHSSVIDVMRKHEGRPLNDFDAVKAKLLSPVLDEIIL